MPTDKSRETRHELSFEESFLRDGVTPACDCGWIGNDCRNREAARREYAGHLKASRIEADVLAHYGVDLRA